jgi:hypothetical protein
MIEYERFRYRGPQKNGITWGELKKWIEEQDVKDDDVVIHLDLHEGYAIEELALHFKDIYYWDGEYISEKRGFLLY